MRRLRTLLALFAMLAAASATSAAAPAGAANAAWSIVPSPNRNGAVSNDLNGASCVSAIFCTAVGSHGGDRETTLIESWNGTAWKVVPSPNAGSDFNRLSGVSCISAVFCTAVGFYSNGRAGQTLIESWDGTAWSVVPSPSPGTVANYLYGVSCISANSCTAVGYYANDNVGSQTLIESWNGTAWKVVPSPNPGTKFNLLNGVSCISARSCTAVGYYSNGDHNNQTLIESGTATTAWSVVSSPNPGTEGNYLNGVSCISAVSCTAVGIYFGGAGQTLIESWNGTNWSVVPSPNANDRTNTLTSVSCISAVSCTAVGYYFISLDFTQTLIESWDGTAWKVVPSPNPGTENNNFSGVSCVLAVFCTAVGHYFNGSVDQTLIESWNGTAWSVVPTPSPTGAVSNTLSGVSCVSASSCTAVGDYNSGSNYQTLIESRTATTAWSVVSSPNAGSGTDNYLNGVSCVSTNFCTAVGYYFGVGGPQTLIESWNGKAWSVVSSPNPGTGDDHLYGVTCVSASSCTAVGYYANGNVFAQTLVESWDGTSWSVVPSPSPGTKFNYLYGVSCVSASSCTAVGYYNGIVFQTLIESWDGTSWSVVPSPNPGTDNRLNGVSCVSASSCTAVGFYYNGSVDLTLIESWDGTSWSAVPSPNPGPPNYLYGVSCVSASSCTAVGIYRNNGFKTLIEAWDGTTWSVVSSPSPGTVSNKLAGVSCVLPVSCTAVGSYSNTGVYRTLIEVYA